METLLTSLQTALETLLKMPILVLVVLALNVIGWAFKRAEWVPNRIIPVIVVVLGTVLVPFLVAATPAGEVSHTLPYPGLADWIRRILIGIIVGFAAWALHATLLKHIEPYLPGDNGKTGPNHTPPP